MKTKEELNALKEKVEALNKKLHELTDEELAQVTGGVERHTLDEEDPVLETQRRCPNCGKWYTGVHLCVIT